MIVFWFAGRTFFAAFWVPSSVAGAAGEPIDNDMGVADEGADVSEPHPEMMKIPKLRAVPVCTILRMSVRSIECSAVSRVRESPNTTAFNETAGKLSI